MAEFFFADFAPEVNSDAPGVNDLAVIRCARLATRYFCQNTDALTRETNPLLDIVAGQFTYAIPQDSMLRPVVRALDVWIEDTHLVARSSDQLSREQDLPRSNQPWVFGSSGGLSVDVADQKWQTAEEYPPHFYFQERPDTIRLVGIPNEDHGGVLKIVSSVQPAMTHDSVDQYLVDNWYEILVGGTHGYLLQMAQKPWTDVKRGLLLQQQFEADVAGVMDEITAGFDPNSQVVGHVRAYP